MSEEIKEVTAEVIEVKAEVTVVKVTPEVKEVKAEVKPEEKKSTPKKIRRYTKEQVVSELNRLDKINGGDSTYYKQLKNRMAELK